MTTKSPLEDSKTAAFAWGRYRRLMGGMALLTLVVVVAVELYLYFFTEGASIHFYIAAGLGVGLTMLLTGGLMGLVFLSSGTGHDDAVVDPLEDELPRH